MPPKDNRIAWLNEMPKGRVSDWEGERYIEEVVFNSKQEAKNALHTIGDHYFDGEDIFEWRGDGGVRTGQWAVIKVYPVGVDPKVDSARLERSPHAA